MTVTIHHPDGSIITRKMAEGVTLTTMKVVTGRSNRLARHVSKSPRLIRWLQRHRAPADRGIGDTLSRLLGGKKTKRFATWFYALGGLSCGCTDAQVWLNQIKR